MYPNLRHACYPHNNGNRRQKTLSKAWRHMVHHQGPPFYPILETGTVPSYHPLGSFNKCLQNPLGAIIKYLPCVCGSLWKEHKREDIEHVCYSNAVSDDEGNPKQVHTPKGTAPLFKPVSFDGNLRTINPREENVHDLAPPGTQIPTQPPDNFILTNIEEDNMSSDSPQSELLRWHYRLWQCLFTRLRLLAALCILPRKLLKVNPTKCAGCLYFAMKKRPWQTKSVKNRGSIWEASAPGECISVDRTESSTPVFIVQPKGNTTNHSYLAA